jgi:DNA processing protein
LNENNQNNLRPWFALKSVPGVGNHLYKKLMNHFGSPKNVFQASVEDLLHLEGMTRKTTAAIKHFKCPQSVENDLSLTLEKGYQVVTMNHPEYPPLLHEIPDPPPFLYVYGKINPLAPHIAVVGSRNATNYGIAATKRLCDDLASLGITIVSGMARGIDTAAHIGAVRGKGKTIAVLGSGFGRIYPAENRELFHNISKNGAVITEFSMFTEPESYNFPVRNRIISGMSLGTVVVEATKKSGSLITARLAGEQNREVFAIPGSIHSFKSIGTHTLIKQGAKLVEHAQDILEEFPFLRVETDQRKPDAPMQSTIQPWMSDSEKCIMKALDEYPLHIDEIVRKTKIEPGKLSGLLLNLELQGAICQSPGKFFSVSREKLE